MKTISEIFNIERGTSYFNQFVENENADYNYVTTSGEKQGVKCRVEYNANYKIYPAGTLTVAMQGSVLSCFVQTHQFYLQTHVAALIPKEEMDIKTKLLYAYLINKHSYRFNYGRKANRTLGLLQVPEISEIPQNILNCELDDYSDIKESKYSEQVVLPPINKWKNFKYDELFTLARGNGGTIASAKRIDGTNEFITASAENNGLSLYTGKPTTEKANTITVANDGSVGEAFYHSQAYLANSAVTVLELKNHTLTPAIAMFLITLIKKEQFKFNYGRKWGLARMVNSIIRLPVKEDQTPDWELMENYINSLPYSKYL